jgi:hypothetical protein
MLSEEKARLRLKKICTKRQQKELFSETAWAIAVLMIPHFQISILSSITACRSPRIASRNVLIPV